MLIGLFSVLTDEGVNGIELPLKFLLSLCLEFLKFVLNSFLSLQTLLFGQFFLSVDSFVSQFFTTAVTTFTSIFFTFRLYGFFLGVDLVNVLGSDTLTSGFNLIFQRILKILLDFSSLLGYDRLQDFLVVSSTRVETLATFRNDKGLYFRHGGLREFLKIGVFIGHGFHLVLNYFRGLLSPEVHKLIVISLGRMAVRVFLSQLL
jgi:hypothetical protein